MNKGKKKWLAAVMVGILTVSMLVGCGDGGNNESESDDGNVTASEGLDKVVVGMDADPGTMNPWGSSSTALLRTKLYPFQTLFQFDSEWNLTSVIGESWTQDDATHYTVKICEGVVDSAGNSIKAADVLFSYQQAAESPSMNSTFKYVDIDGCSVVDEYTIQLAFNQETEFAFSQLCRQVCIVSQASYEADPDEMVNNPVGSGPYVLSDWIVGTSLTFTKNENYWREGTNEQNVNTIEVRIISEASQRAIELETGGVDIIYDCQATDVSRFEDNSDYQVVVDTGTKTLSTYFNCSDQSPCGDKRIRQAIAYAVDSVAIAQVACEGYGEATQSIAHPLTAEWRDSYDTGTPLYAQDKEKALQLLAEAGYGEGELTLHVMVDETAIKRSAAQILQAACSEIGINVVIDQLETAVFQANIGDLSAWDMYMGVGQSDVYTVASLVTQIEKTGYPEDSELYTILNEAFRVYDDVTADEAIAAWTEELPIYYMVNVQNVYVYSSKIGNFSIDKNNCFWAGTFTAAQ